MDLFTVPINDVNTSWKWRDAAGLMLTAPLSSRAVPDPTVLISPGGEWQMSKMANLAAMSTAYSWYGLNGDNGCRCSETADGTCDSPCALVSGDGDNAAEIRLDMELAGHDAASSTSPNFAPVVLTIDNIIPGMISPARD
mmetsp:Transcript_89025/g.237482  ORF Transcript_89025/g.237482 Transcript_89025/m.237482 type:complete len:140 (-) Transcript_89025:1037-1456(-)